MNKQALDGLQAILLLLVTLGALVGVVGIGIGIWLDGDLQDTVFDFSVYLLVVAICSGIAAWGLSFIEPTDGS